MAGSSRHRDAIALLGAFVLVAVPVGIFREIRSSANPVDSATLYAGYLVAPAITGPLLVALALWWWKGRRAQATPATAAQLMAAADQLAVGMLDAWRTEAAERQITVPAPVRVRWQWGPADVTPPPAQVITTPAVGTGPRPLPKPNLPEPNPDPPAVLLDAGVVTRLHDEVYRKLPHGRLVLLGGRGAGKTGAMILLLLAALEHRHRVPEAQRGEVPVPVWLTLGGWDPATQTLHQWATATMYRDHPYLRAPDYGPDAAGELLRTGGVALFLDGLDEMAPAVQHRALARVDQECSGLRIVLSSRPGEYRQAITGQRMHNAAVIEVQPVDPDEASAYLLHDQIGAQHDRWAQVGTYLTDNPGSVAARALDNPLTLSLARATYQDQDPRPLTDPARFPTVTALREHLIDRILIIAYPDERERAHATHWLAWIAHHLGSDRDLAWWHIPTWVRRWQLFLAVGLVVGLAVGLVVGLAGGLVVGLAGGLASGLAGGLVVGLAGGYEGETGKEPQAIIPIWPRLRELLGQLPIGFMLAFMLVVVSVFVFGLVFGLVFVFVVGIIFGLVVVFGWTMPLTHAATATPDTTFRMDRRTSTVRGLAVGLMLGLMSGLTVGLMGGLADGLAFGLTVGLAGGLAFGLTFGLAVGLADSSARMVGLTQLIFMITGAGRVNFIRVLEDAHHRQVLRQAGTVYQFRHAELQEHLIKIHRQRTRPPMNT